MTPQQSIAHYRIVSKLGEGGMGAVYRATDTKLGRDVAIKVLPDSFAGDPDRLARFTREAQVLASLNHPQIAAIYGVEERAIVMELVEGQTLAGPLPVEEALPLIHQLIDALEYAHEKGVVHRDLKPANIKVTPDRQLKVLDFGLAKALSSETPAGDPAASPTLTMRATMAGMIMGTAAYMSPEQARGHNVDKRADIWSFGVVLYEMLTGRQLFGGETVSDTLAAVLRHEPDFGSVPARFHRLLRLCLTRDPRLRLRDISGARLLLEEAFVPGAPAPARNRLPWAVAAISAAIAATALGFALRPAPKTARPLIRLNVDLGQDAVEGQRNTVALSPDGSHIAYLARDAKGAVRLAVRALDQAAPQLLAGTEDASDPFFSHDGREIGFVAEGSIKKIPALGGAVLVVGDTFTMRGGAAINTGNTLNVRGVAWSRDGSMIYGSAFGGGLFRQPAGGGAPAPFTSLAGGEVSHRWPQFLPQERAIVFVSHTQAAGYDDASIQVLPLPEGGRATVLKGGFAPRYVPGGHLLYAHDGALFGAAFDPDTLRIRGTPVPLLDDLASVPFSGGGQYDVSDNGTLVYLRGKARDARWIPVIGGESGKTQALALPLGVYQYLAASPDGRSIAYVNTSRELWVYDRTRETATRLLPAGAADHPVWTPDGKHLIFAGMLGEHGEQAIWSIRSDGAGERQQLFSHSSSVEAGSFSPDGGRLALQIMNPQSKFDIVILPLDWTDPEHPRAGKPESFLSTPMVESQPAFSPDGKWMAYRSGDGSTGEVFVQPFLEAGNRVQISNGGGSFPQWSRDGRRLFFESPQYRILAAEIAGSGTSLTAGKPRLWMDRQLLDRALSRNYTVLPDGQNLVFLARPEESEKAGSVHVTFLLNFSDELKRRLP